MQELAASRNEGKIMNTTVSAKTGTETVLSVDYGVRLSPGEARQRIFANSTLEQPNKISVPGFEADTPVLHTVNGAEINIRKRVYYLNRNGQRVLTLRIEPTDNGSRLIGYFEKPKVSLMLVAALIVGTIVLLFIGPATAISVVGRVSCRAAGCAVDLVAVLGS